MKVDLWRTEDALRNIQFYKEMKHYRHFFVVWEACFICNQFATLFIPIWKTIQLEHHLSSLFPRLAFWYAWKKHTQKLTGKFHWRTSTYVAYWKTELLKSTASPFHLQNIVWFPLISHLIYNIIMCILLRSHAFN